MPIRNLVLICLLILLTQFAYGQQKFKVATEIIGAWKGVYSLVDEQGTILRQLDTSRYLTSLNSQELGYFAIFGRKGDRGWTAIDANEKTLFQVYNTSFGEPSPDDLIENKIRIIDESDRIGFADEKGIIIIKPQFEIVTAFHNGKAIIGEICKKIPWSDHVAEGGCQHFSIKCGRYGYINDKGEVLKIGNYTFEQMEKEIGWTQPGY